MTRDAIVPSCHVTCDITNHDPLSASAGSWQLAQCCSMLAPKVRAVIFFIRRLTAVLEARARWQMAPCRSKMALDKILANPQMVCAVPSRGSMAVSCNCRSILLRNSTGLLHLLSMIRFSRSGILRIVELLGAA